MGKGAGRAPCCQKVGLNKGSWTPKEDLRLISHIQKYGHANWRALPKKAGLLRCGKSCRLRWINYLRPDIKRGNFNEEEERTIIKLHGLLGNKWSKIASCLPGRTDNEIKNVWNTYLKKKLAWRERKDEENNLKEDSSPSSSTKPVSNYNSIDEQPEYLISPRLSQCSFAISFVEDKKRFIQEDEGGFLDIPTIIEPEFWNMNYENNANAANEKKNWLEYLELELGLFESKEGNQEETLIREDLCNQLEGDIQCDFQFEPSSPLLFELLYDIDME